MSATAPANGLQGHRQRPSIARPIVPVIPLPYLQKRKQNVVAFKKVEAEPIAPTIPSTPTSPSPQPAADIATAVPTPSASNSSPEVIVASESAEEAASAADTATVVEKGPKKDVQELPEVSSENTAQASHQAHKALPVVSSDNRSTESRSTYNMPPPFVPAGHGHSNSVTAEAAKFPQHPSFGGQHPMHQTHPSVGSVVFGGYPDSNNSSPAPPVSGGGIGQFPPQHHHEGGRSQAVPYVNGGPMHTYSNGYSQMGPPASNGYHPRQDGFVNQNPTMDNFARRQMAGPGALNGYSPSGTPIGLENQVFPPTFDPSTPHSFHGSQSSAADANGQQFFNQYPQAVMPNGSNGHGEEVRLYHQPRPKGRTGSQPLLPLNQGPNMSQPLMPQNMDNLDGLVGYLQSQFGNPDFADYNLELRYSDDRAPPLRILGHNLLFARSPTLKGLMTAQARDSTTDGHTLRTLLIESNDRFLRSDAFSVALNRLYAGALLDLGASINVPVMTQSSTVPGSPADRFDLALGYAAAGNILQIPPVIHRGADIASHLISWATLEKALDFALDGGLDSQWTSEDSQNPASPTYGPAVNSIINSCLNFVITTFPPTFELDTTVTDPTYNRRIPLVLDNRPSSSNPRLSSIRFGDHHSEDVLRYGQHTNYTAILSRVLLNLPYHLLKYILESSRLGNVQGWATAELRKKAMRSVVEEREKRRNKVRENASVSNAARKADTKAWEAVGWEESLVPVTGAAETSALHRTWVDFVLPEASGN